MRTPALETTRLHETPIRVSISNVSRDSGSDDNFTVAYRPCSADIPSTLNPRSWIINQVQLHLGIRQTFRHHRERAQANSRFATKLVHPPTHPPLRPDKTEYEDGPPDSVTTTLSITLGTPYFREPFTYNQLPVTGDGVNPHLFAVAQVWEIEAPP